MERDSIQSKSQTKKVIFSKYGDIAVKDVDALFTFHILYFNKWSLRDTILESEYIVASTYRGLSNISLRLIDDKSYLLINNSLSSAKEIDNFLQSQCEQGEMVTAEMLYYAILDSIDKPFPKMRLQDIYYNYNWLNEK